MTAAPRLHSRIARSMAGVLAACVLIDAAALVRALRAASVDVRPEPAVAAVPQLPVASIDSAAAQDDTLPDDPFDADRGGVVTQAGEPAPAAPIAAPADQMIALVGTVVRADGGSVAVCQLGNQPPRVLHVGERIGALTLLEVEQGRAAFRDTTGARVSLRIITPGA